MISVNKNNIYNFQSAFLTENVKDELEFVKFAFRYKKPSAFKNLFRHWYHYANNFKLPTDWIYQTLTFQRYNEIKNDLNHLGIGLYDERFIFNVKIMGFVQVPCGFETYLVLKDEAFKEIYPRDFMLWHVAPRTLSELINNNYLVIKQN